MTRRRSMVFLVICIIVGFSIVAQAKSTDGMKLYVSPKTISDMETAIEGEQADIANIQRLTSEAAVKLEEYERILAEEDEEFNERLLSELELYKMQTGAIPVHGPGVIITLDDASRDLQNEFEHINELLVHDQDLLLIISELNRSGAEAISVNGHRIHNGSTIYCAGYTVRINGRPEARPFIIKAIGDPARMSATLIGPDGWGTRLKDYYDLTFKLEVEEDVEIAAYSKEPSFQYSKKVNEGEESPL